LWGFWRTFFKPESCFWMAFTFQGQSSVSWRWRTFRATKHQQNGRKCVPAHMSLKTTEFVTDNNMVIVPHPPYS
jgi:hypothetical protein